MYVPGTSLGVILCLARGDAFFRFLCLLFFTSRSDGGGGCCVPRFCAFLGYRQPNVRASYCFGVDIALLLLLLLLLLSADGRWLDYRASLPYSLCATCAFLMSLIL